MMKPCVSPLAGYRTPNGTCITPLADGRRKVDGIVYARCEPVAVAPTVPRVIPETIRFEVVNLVGRNRMIFRTASTLAGNSTCA